MAFVSAKDILISNDFLNSSTSSVDGKKSRRASHEFQAFAYKLAYDLNDLQNLKIYLKLAKTVERSIVEQAYTYAIDATTEDKGKVFLWKLKNLREEIVKFKNKYNFEDDYITKSTKKLRNSLAKQLLTKNYAEAEDQLEIYKQFFLSFVNSPIVSLCIGLDNIAILEMQSLLFDCKVYGLDVSPALVRLAKSKKSISSTKTKLIAKDFIKNTYKANFYDSIVIDDFWKFIPKDSEKKWISEFSRIMKPDGKILIGLEFSESSGQEWKSFKPGKNEFMYYSKSTIKSEFLEDFQRLGFGLEGIGNFDRKSYCIFRKLIF